MKDEKVIDILKEMFYEISRWERTHPPKPYDKFRDEIITKYFSQLNALDKINEVKIFNILTKELPYDYRTTRFSIRKKVAHVIAEGLK